MKGTTERLLLDCDDCQFLLLSRLADEAEDRGDSVWATGWRWLGQRRRWPVAVTAHATRYELPKVVGGDPIPVEEVTTRHEWWRYRDRDWSCSLPRLLMEHVRRASGTKHGQTCSFATAGAALACAAFQAGNLLQMVGSIDDEPARQRTEPFRNFDADAEDQQR